MGKALEIVTAIVTAPSTGASATACSGNSLTIRDSRRKITMLDIWRTGQAVGALQITSPFMHDTTVGMQFACPSGTQLLLRGQGMELKTQDTLELTMEGSATGGDIEHASFLVYYEDLPGISGRFISPSELKRRLIDIHAFENTLSLGTSGCYDGEEAINAESDQLKANTDYALLGCTVQVPVHAVRWRAPDWGNLGVGMPTLNTEGWHNPYFFKELSELHNLPLIPVFNSSNKDLVLLDGVVHESGTDAVISTVLGRLR
jgi:hypothetical protein